MRMVADVVDFKIKADKIRVTFESKSGPLKGKRVVKTYKEEKNRGDEGKS